MFFQKNHLDYNIFLLIDLSQKMAQAQLPYGALTEIRLDAESDNTHLPDSIQRHYLCISLFFSKAASINSHIMLLNTYIRL